MQLHQKTQQRCDAVNKQLMKQKGEQKEIDILKSETAIKTATINAMNDEIHKLQNKVNDLQREKQNILVEMINGNINICKKMMNKRN